ncbi:MAG: hypothetical protein DI537_20315 [Stutzerimonas stutzeri]|nr:MAG: hypothetical protein DI537_20315 [Stutzerimonas stutzeri]
MMKNNIVGASLTAAAAAAAAMAGAEPAPKRKPSIGERAAAAAKRVKDAAKKVVNAEREWPLSHPHVNPHYRKRKGGLLYFIVGRGNKPEKRATAQDIGRWMPHNGAREMARRVRQRQARANG